jgi:hypothetical protein
MSFTGNWDVKLSAALAKTKALAANRTENVGQNTNVVLADTLGFGDLIAARHLGPIAALGNSILNLVVGCLSNGATVARQGHGSSSKEDGGDEELHFESLRKRQGIKGGVMN